MKEAQLDRDRLKQELVAALRKNPRTQVLAVVADIEYRIGRQLQHDENETLLELIHEFLVSNILMPAMDRHNAGWPWLGVTSHGRFVLDTEGPPIYDYEGYLAQLHSNVPQLDHVVEKYVSESLQAYQRNLFYASMVMLGCASERAIRLLIEAYTTAIEDETNRERLRSRISGRDISVAYERFRESFDSTRVQVRDAHLPKDFDLHVDGVFTFVRLIRNSIVHPDSLPEVTSTIVAAHLQQFIHYAACVFGLAEYYRQNKVTV